MESIRHYIMLLEGAWKLSYAHGYRSWYNPETKEFFNVIGANSHGKYVFEHPEIFNVPIDKLINTKMYTYDDYISPEQYMIKLATDKGWIRVAGGDRNNPDRYMILQGNDAEQIHRLAKRFYYDQGGSLQNLGIKVGDDEWVMNGNQAVKDYVLRRFLPPMAEKEKRAA